MALEAVQAQAGHTSIESTRIYLHIIKPASTILAGPSVQPSDVCSRAGDTGAPKGRAAMDPVRRAAMDPVRSAAAVSAPSRPTRSCSMRAAQPPIATIAAIATGGAEA